MRVSSNLPFDFCENCPNIEPDLNVNKLYSDGEVTDVLVEVFCLNRKLCEQLEKNGLQIG